MWIKICGITSKRELKDAVTLYPDALGFVVETEESKRNLSIEKAKKLMMLVPPSIATVAVTLHAENLEEITTTADYIQLYEDTFPPFHCGVIRGYLHSEFTAEQFTKIKNKVDMVLIDSGYGSGEVHDWSITGKINETVTKPLILAGGLTPWNVVEAVQEVAPFGVDVSSGVEGDGKKNHQLMKAFIEKARGVESERKILFSR